MVRAAEKPSDETFCMVETTAGHLPLMITTSTLALETVDLLRFNLMRVEIRELRPEVVAESDEVLVHYRSRTNV